MKEKELSFREQIMVQGILSGLNNSEAARRAGYAQSTVRKKIHILVGRRRVRAAISEAIIRSKGIKIEELTSRISEGLEAVKMIRKPKADQKDEKFIYYPDYATRLKYVKLAIQLLDLENYE